jgi:hypothetical protein
VHRLALVIVAIALFPAQASRSQAPDRHVTTAHALSAYSHFFHGAQVTFLGTVHDTDGLSVVPLSETQRAIAIWQQPQTVAGEVVVRGTFLDLGRLEPGDSRLASIDTKKILDAVSEGQWPGRNQVFLVTGARYEKYEPEVQPTMRAIALDPARYAGKEVTLSGRFRGRNLLGDQPVSPGKSPHEYVLRIADASIWVSGLRPRGRGFTLDPDARRDTREWVRVSGVVRHEAPVVWIEGKVIDLAKPEADAPPEAPAPVPPGPAPEIVFSAPLDGETDVATGIVLRVQFSRDIDPHSLRDQVAVAYGLRADGSSPGTPPVSSTSYRAANRSIEIRFAEPLAPYTTVIVAFGNEIKATDGVAMKPARISFVTGR